MSKKLPGTLVAELDKHNLELAHKIKLDVERRGSRSPYDTPFYRDWAKRVIARLEPKGESK